MHLRAGVSSRKFARSATGATKHPEAVAVGRAGPQGGSDRNDPMRLVDVRRYTSDGWLEYPMQQFVVDLGAARRSW